MGLRNKDLAEGVFTKWIKEKGSDIIVINDIPFLTEDCVSILEGKIIEANKQMNDIVIKTTDNIQYILKEFDQSIMTC